MKGYCRWNTGSDSDTTYTDSKKDSLFDWEGFISHTPEVPRDTPTLMC